MKPSLQTDLWTNRPNPGTENRPRTPYEPLSVVSPVRVGLCFFTRTDSRERISTVGSVITAIATHIRFFPEGVFEPSHGLVNCRSSALGGHRKFWSKKLSSCTCKTISMQGNDASESGASLASNARLMFSLKFHTCTQCTESHSDALPKS